jgi:hypothetical protein
MQWLILILAGQAEVALAFCRGKAQQAMGVDTVLSLQAVSP